eukprot:3525243-Pyramimonas_sp.AAC.1
MAGWQHACMSRDAATHSYGALACIGCAGRGGRLQRALRCGSARSCITAAAGAPLGCGGCDGGTTRVWRV